MNRLDEKALELRSNLGLDDETKAALGAIELKTMEYSLADAIREGSTVSDQAYNWGNGDTACALTAAVISAKARGYIK
jgi:hypothetical protein